MTSSSQPPSAGSAVIYARVSTRVQEETGTSLDSQEAACIAHARALGYRVGRIAREVYTGAELWDRPVLSDVRAAIRAGAHTALIFYALDRLSRDPIHLAILVEEAERHGCAVLCVSEPLDRSEEGKLINYVRGYAAKIEREKIRERQMRGKRQRALDGKISGAGTELYGYRRDKARGVREVYEPEATVIREIFSLAATEHLSCRAIARHLNARGVPLPAAHRVTDKDPAARGYWQTTTVWRILRNPEYKGEAVALRYQVPPGSRSRRSRPRPAEERIALPAGVVPPIVPPALWAAANGALATQSGDRTRNQRMPYLLRGRVTCGVCGRKLWPSWSFRSGEHEAAGDPKVRTYRCSGQATAEPADRCNRVLRADRLEARVWAAVEAALSDPALIGGQAERQRERGGAAHTQLAGDLERARQQIARIEARQQRLVARYAATETEASDDGSDDALWTLMRQQVAALDAEKRQWQTTVRELDQRVAAAETTRVRQADVTDLCRRVRERLQADRAEGSDESDEFAARTRVLDALGVTVRADTRAIDITYANLT